MCVFLLSVLTDFLNYIFHLTFYVYTCMYIRIYTVLTHSLSLSLSLWDCSGYSLKEELGPLLLSLVSSAPLSLQPATAQALGLWLHSHPHRVSNSLTITN